MTDNYNVILDARVPNTTFYKIDSAFNTAVHPRKIGQEKFRIKLGVKARSVSEAKTVGEHLFDVTCSAHNLSDYDLLEVTAYNPETRRTHSQSSI